MGRRRKNAPRRGSLAYLPRGRAARPIGRINHWPEVDVDKPRLLGLAGYKAGMSFIYVVGDIRGNPTFGQEVHSPVTIVETPPMVICAIRGYAQTPTGLNPVLETWAEKLPADMNRVLVLPRKKEQEEKGEAAKEKEDAKAAELEDEQKRKVVRPTAKTGDLYDLRAVVATQPRETGSHHKKPEIFEVKVDGGSSEEQLTYLKGLLGKEVRASDIFQEGDYVDVIGVTKGKGIQGPVKRWGVKTLPHKSRKTVRGVGTLGPWTPHYVMYTVPRAGQMGFHQRTEINKRILRIGDDGENLTPKGGFPHYGAIRKDYLILSGSVPGPAMRMIKLRCAMRPPTKREETKIVISYTPFSSRVAA
jgi:large subunit ribosomal protein L3